MSSRIFRFTGSKYFRQRLILATLSGFVIRIDKIRPDDKDPGLRDYEASFLRLLEKMTNGSIIEISYTGTSIVYKPGIIIGGTISHDCGLSKSIGYFLEYLITIAPFAKTPFIATLTGITCSNEDLSVDSIRTVTLPILAKFGIQDSSGIGNTSIELRILKRGSMPLGGGEIRFSCPIIKQIKPLQWINQGRIRRIRGIAHATRVSPQIANRLVDSARLALKGYISDIHIYTDVYRGVEAGKSPGWAMTLVAESTTGALISAEYSHANTSTNIHSNNQKSLRPKGFQLDNISLEESNNRDIIEDLSTPEDLGTLTSNLLLEEISKGGCVDSYHQWLVCLLMAISTEDVSKIRLGRLTSHTIQFMRDLKMFFGTMFKVRMDTEDGTVVLSTVGCGYVNTNKPTA